MVGNITETSMDDLLTTLAEIEVNDGVDVISDVLKPILNISEEFVRRVEAFNQEVKESRLKYALHPEKYKSKDKASKAEIYANQTNELLLKGMQLVYSIREKITGESIIFRTVNYNLEKETVDIIEIGYKELFSGDYTNFGKSNNVLKNTLSFNRQNIIEYHQSKLNNAISQDEKEDNVSLKHDWEQSTKTLFIEVLKEYNKRNTPKNHQDKFNRGHLFEFIDQLNEARVRSYTNHRRGVAYFKNSLAEEVKYIFDNQDLLFDNISFIMGGDTLNAQDKLLNGTLGSLKSLINVFKGWTSNYSSYKGIIPELKDIVYSKKTIDSQGIVEKLMSLFTKKGVILKNNLIKSAEEEAVKKSEEYIKSYVEGAKT